LGELVFEILTRKRGKQIQKKPQEAGWVGKKSGVVWFGSSFRAG
jgi:hypothetical protein